MLTVQVSHDDLAGKIALDNYAKRNALSAGTIREILDALADFARQGVPVVVLRTNGAVPVWSAGHDVTELTIVNHLVPAEEIETKTNNDLQNCTVHARQCAQSHAHTKRWVEGQS